ncbi:MAG: hypothetical protein Q9184_006054, partial [Pyrenodesmia sp. 2 TL-2023]
SGTVSGTGALPPYPTDSAPYPISNSTISTGPTGIVPPPPPPPPITPECPPPVTVTFTSSVTVTTTITTSDLTPFPTGTGIGGTAAPTGTASAGYNYPYYRRGMEIRGLKYREEKKERSLVGVMFISVRAFIDAAGMLVTAPESGMLLVFWEGDVENCQEYLEVGVS